MSTDIQRYLIVNADDFGLSSGINRGIIESYEHGIVTSASLMVRWPAAQEAATYALTHPDFSLGLHLDLGEWIFRDDEWAPQYIVVAGEGEGALREEVVQQLQRFRQMVGKDPTHLDSHQHVHTREPARAAVLSVAKELNVPLRHSAPGIFYCGEFYGQTSTGDPRHEGITADSMRSVLKNLRQGVTEMAVHPGYAVDLQTMYKVEREQEVAVLCDPCIRAALNAEHIHLRSFANLDHFSP